MVELVYRDPTGDICDKLIFSGFSGSDQRPQGRMIRKGIDLGVRSFNPKEVKAWEARKPGQTVIEMGERNDSKHKARDQGQGAECGAPSSSPVS